MVITLVVLVVLGGSGAAGWVWWQGRVSQAAGQQQRDAALLSAALALSDPHEGGTLAWEAGIPTYHPAPETGEQERALLKAWELTLRQELLEPPSGQNPLPLQLADSLPAMLPVANAGLYTARPRSPQEARSNMQALAATSLLMQRRAQSWLKHHSGAAQELAAKLLQEPLEQVNLAQWRRRVQNRPTTMPDLNMNTERAAVQDKAVQDKETLVSGPQ